MYGSVRANTQKKLKKSRYNFEVDNVFPISFGIATFTFDFFIIIVIVNRQGSLDQSYETTEQQFCSFISSWIFKGTKGQINANDQSSRILHLS